MKNANCLVKEEESLGFEAIDSKNIDDPLHLDLRSVDSATSMCVPYNVFAYLRDKYGADIAVPIYRNTSN